MATIVLVPQQGKPPKDCSSYRPISLLNFEAKVLTKALASRVRAVISKIVHPDPFGFMPHRGTRLNLCHLYGILHSTNDPGHDNAVLLSLDGRMAFNSVEWPYYLFESLTRSDFGPRFLEWVKLLYNELLAWMHVNNTNNVLLTFTLQKCMREGGLLSPMIFALVLVPLAA
ncbi:hypothetical protein NDU88_006140 [Pleurodeles waltl]|uniref:Reverse transcriptase domain-containing protein n=1 Tax=Pleurodeles waltl TaxID=8319 RepID=A0AAV7SNT6_PLEWA|nr:hypothetical protein NDU88_006140 [Pleurodeles waltl]